MRVKSGRRAITFASAALSARVSPQSFPNSNSSFRLTLKSSKTFFADEQYIYANVLSAEVEHEQELEVFNLEVEDHTYIANRVAVHNCTTRVVTGAGVPQITAISVRQGSAWKRRADYRRRRR
jgi:hypothetical protein